MPRPIIPHIISLSGGQQIPINLQRKLFPILDQDTLGYGGEGRTTPHLLLILPFFSCILECPDSFYLSGQETPKSSL